MSLQGFHKAAGIISFVIFLGTGMYMRLTHPGMTDVDLAERIFLRSRHIYILAAALVHLMAGAYLTDAKTRRRRIVQLIGSSFLTVATVLLITGFFTESAIHLLQAHASGLGLYSLLAGTLLHFIAGGSNEKPQ